MTQFEFDSQMVRLVKTFGKAAYADERCFILWQEVKDMPASWFIRTVNEFIGSYRQAPLLAEFREAVAKGREKVYEIQKRQHKQDAHGFMQGDTFPNNEEIQYRCEMIRRRLKGGVSDAEYAEFIEQLESGRKIDQQAG